MQEVKIYAIYIYFLYWTDIKFSTLYTSNRFDKTSVQKKKGNILSSPLIKLYFIQSVTYSTDQVNEVSKMFIISLITNRGRRLHFEQTFEFNSPYSKIQPNKLTNNSTPTN